MSLEVRCLLYSSINPSEFGCQLSSPRASSSDVGAGTSSSTLFVGLYQCIVRIGFPLTRVVSLHLLLGMCSTQREARGCLLSRSEPQGQDFKNTPKCVRRVTSTRWIISFVAIKALRTGYVSERSARKAKGGCEHLYPILVDSEGEGRRARCLGCGAVGPIRKDTGEAREALLDMRW